MTDKTISNIFWYFGLIFTGAWLYQDLYLGISTDYWISGMVCYLMSGMYEILYYIKRAIVVDVSTFPGDDMDESP